SSRSSNERATIAVIIPRGRAEARRKVKKIHQDGVSFGGVRPYHLSERPSPVLGKSLSRENWLARATYRRRIGPKIGRPRPRNSKGNHDETLSMVPVAPR